MKPLNLAARLVVIATFSLSAVSGAVAATAQLAGTIATAPGQAISFSNSSGILQTLSTGKALAIDGTTAALSLNSTIQSSATQIGAATSAAGQINAAFGGGSFEILNSASSDLLSGTFTGLELSSTSPTAAGLLVNVGGTVTYTGGAYLADYDSSIGVSPVTDQTGTLGLTLSAVSPGIAIGAGGKLASFSDGVNPVAGHPKSGKIAGFSTTFDVNTPVVPESNGSLLMLAALAPFAIVGMVIRRKHADTTQA